MALNDKGIQRVAATVVRPRVPRVKSALNPILWLCPTVLLPCLALAAYAETPTWLRIVVVALGFAPIVVALSAFAYFVRVDPRRLQSEDYQIRERLLESIREDGDKEHPWHPLNDPDSLDIILNLRGQRPGQGQEDQ